MLPDTDVFPAAAPSVLPKLRGYQSQRL